jgi:hypothetical protein
VSDQKEAYEVITTGLYGLENQMNAAAKRGFVVFKITVSGQYQNDVTVFMKKILEPSAAPDPSRDTHSAWDASYDGVAREQNR